MHRSGITIPALKFTFTNSSLKNRVSSKYPQGKFPVNKLADNSRPIKFVQPYKIGIVPVSKFIDKFMNSKV